MKPVTLGLSVFALPLAGLGAPAAAHAGRRARTSPRPPCRTPR